MAVGFLGIGQELSKEERRKAGTRLIFGGRTSRVVGESELWQCGQTKFASTITRAEIRSEGS